MKNDGLVFTEVGPEFPIHTTIFRVAMTTNNFDGPAEENLLVSNEVAGDGAETCKTLKSAIHTYGHERSLGLSWK